MYTSSVDYLSTREGCTLPPWIIYPPGRGVHSLRALFIHWKGVYTPSVDYLSTGEGCTLPPWIISPLADRYREALLRWAEAKGLRACNHLFPGSSAGLEHKFLEVLGSTPWRHCRWPSLRRGGSAACYARHPQMQFFPLGRWHSVGTALRYATAFQDAAVVGPLRLPAEVGVAGLPGTLPTWRFGPPICTLQKPSPYRQQRSTPGLA